ncbi:MAG: PilT/PilU family type 4a pilus ATPase [Verrucomicrobiota bacterium]
MATRDLVDYLELTCERGGSDLHVSVDSPPMARVHGILSPLEDFNLDRDTCQTLILDVLSETQRATLEETWELDFALQVEGVGRFRGNVHFNRGRMEAAFRHIPSEIPEIEDLGHAEIVEKLCDVREGLIIVTGITGSGKSTTLASMVKRISERRSGVVVSIEDPIEYVFEHSMALVKQREVGTDTQSFGAGLRHVLRQDPDVILVSEMRDLETIQTAVTASETGHLVLSTLHTIDAPKALDRLIDAFPPDQQNQIVAQLANALHAIVAQRLIPRADGKGRALASEVMIMNHGVRACLRTKKFEQLVGLMEIGAAEGMHTFDESLGALFAAREITEGEALAHARDQQRVLEEGDQKRGLFRRRK